MSLPIDQVVDGLHGCGIEKSTYSEDTGHTKAECPVCRKPGALSFGRDAFESSYLICETDGCTPDVIVAALRTGIRSLQTAADEPLAYVREQLDEPDLERIVKHGKTGEAYVLHYAGGAEVALGPAAALLSQTKFRAAYLPQRRRLPTKFILKERAWSRLVECIERGATEQDDVATEREEVRGWLAGYIGRALIVDTTDAGQLYEILDPLRRAPFIDTAGAVYVNLNDFAARLARDSQIRVSARELSTRLAALGFGRAQMQARHGADVRKARYWVSPPDFRMDT